MHFLYPGFLWALTFISVPILIHLFNFRRYRKIIFSDIRFLKQVSEENKKQQTIRHWIILASRILLIAMLVLAFAKPYIPATVSSNSTPVKQFSFYLDNSFSMQTAGPDGSLLDQARNKAAGLASIYGDEVQFQLLTNDFEGKHQRWVNKKEFLKMLEEVKISPAHRTAIEVYSRQKQLAGSAPVTAYWLSDFQRNLEVKNLPSDSGMIRIPVILESEGTGNIWIDSAWFVDPVLRKGAGNKLMVKIRNESSEDVANQPLVLKVDGAQKAIQNYSCIKGGATTAEISFSLSDYNWHGFELSLTDYPTIQDDKYFLSGQAIEKFTIVSVNATASDLPFKKVYSLEPFYTYQPVDFSRIDFSVLERADVVILNELPSVSSGLASGLTKFSEAGGVVFYIPSSNPADPVSIASFLENFGIHPETQVTGLFKISSVETSDPLFSKVYSSISENTDWPSVFTCQKFQFTGKYNRTTILKLNNDLPYLTLTRKGAGRLYLLASPLNPAATNLTRNGSVFPPLMLNLPMMHGIRQPSSFVIGKGTVLKMEGNPDTKIVQLMGNGKEFRLEVSGANNFISGKLDGQISEAGIYNVSGSGIENGLIGLNYSRNESDPKTESAGKLEEYFGSAPLDKDIEVYKNKITAETQGRDLWKLFLGLALFFILVESVLLMKFPLNASKKKEDAVQL